MTEEAYNKLNPFDQSEYRLYCENRQANEGTPLPEFLEENV